MGKRIVIEGETWYDNVANEYYHEWAYVDAKTLVRMLDELFGDKDWRFKSKQVRVTLEQIG